VKRDEISTEMEARREMITRDRKGRVAWRESE